MHVAVAIVSYRNPDDVLDCLAALGRSDHSDFEVVICENGGRPACEELQSRAPRRLAGGQAVRLICAPSNLGFAGGVNLCIGEAPDADAVWVLNPDTCPEPSAMAELVARLERGDCEAVGGVIRLPDGRIQAYGGHWQRWLARAVSLGHGLPAGASADADEIERRQNFLNGASMLMGRDFLAATGGMREDYFLYCEEVEWCLRGLRKGMRLGFAPKAMVMHKQGRSTGNTIDLRGRSKLPVYLNERNRVLLSRDCFPGLLPLAVLTTLATILVRFGKRRAWRQMAYALEGWLAGVANRRGPPEWSQAQGPAATSTAIPA